MISLDTETTGFDFHHGAKPYLVTTCDEEGNQEFWEWDVDPLTREPLINLPDLCEIEEKVNSADALVLQNAKFDVKALDSIWQYNQWDWSKTVDTLLAGHLLASNQPHDLTSMAMVYLGVNVAPFEDAIKEATKKARRMCQSKNSSYPDWAIAKVGRSDMPSAKGTIWKMDMWLPRAIAKAKKYPTGECRVVNKRKEPFDVYIGRGSKWGNPFRIDEDGNRKEVIEKYRKRLLKSPLLRNLHELDGKTLGCFCKPGACHGDVLVEEIAKRAHPWWTVCSEYANSDSAVTLLLYRAQEALLKERGHWKIYQHQLKMLPIPYEMEKQGITLNGKCLEELLSKYKRESEASGKVCYSIAKKLGQFLELPKSGSNKSLLSFVFSEDGLELEPIKKSKKTGVPSLDKDVKEEYASSLLEGSDGGRFMSALLDKGQRDTAIQYMESYKSFWLPLGKSSNWRRLYPSLNPTGTATLRWSCKNPNEQNISKKEGFNLRYAFGPAPGRDWFAIDYNNLELRLAAYQAGETEMIRLFEQPDAAPFFGSYHLLVCSILHPQKWKRCTKEGVSFKDKYKQEYSWTKNGNFAVQYGAIERFGTADRAYHIKGAQAQIADRFLRIAALNQKWIEHAEEFGYVETMPDSTVDPDQGYPLLAGRTAWGQLRETTPLNYNIQGTACWVMVRAMIEVREYLKTLKDHHMVMNVHDEVVLDFPKKPKRFSIPRLRKIRGIMEAVGEGISVPLTCEIIHHPKTWSEGVTV